MESNHRPSEYESEALTYWATRAQRSGLTITAKEIALPLRHLSAGGIYGISGVTKPQLWLASKLSLTRPGWICTIVLHIISMTLSYWATGIYGGATGNRTPISGETVRYNSRYTIAPNYLYLLCLLFMLKKSLATKPHIYKPLDNSIYWFVCRW